MPANGKQVKTQHKRKKSIISKSKNLAQGANFSWLLLAVWISIARILFSKIRTQTQND